MNNREKIMANRNLMKSRFGDQGELSDQQKGLPRPPLQKGLADSPKAIQLPDFKSISVTNPNLIDCIGIR